VIRIDDRLTRAAVYGRLTAGRCPLLDDDSLTNDRWERMPAHRGSEKAKLELFRRSERLARARPCMVSEIGTNSDAPFP
jgi:hypothetical protein